MIFTNDYPNLFHFFAGYFPDADFNNLTDEEVVANYIDDCNRSEFSKKELQHTKEELDILINNIDNYWLQVGDEANRYFENQQETLIWLTMIKRELNK
ncbi:hypothetical protein [Chryseobacterium gregarium]|uniref:hypothetical protein n=1 Tax=Chryseobacterium gregarium TaxID=456299 RepID=UPI00041B985F|nr:hypothetical protein [Chryseobacterium gregarium]